jgi:hypothetical protein
MQAMTPAQAARFYAGRGWAVLPLWPPVGPGRCGCGQLDCDNVGKHPIPHLAPHGLHDATSEAGRIGAWWSAEPQANVGIRTGAESGLVVLDVDGEVGADALRGLVDSHGRFDALWARTGSGGWHAYLAHPGGVVPNSARRVGAGLDVRGDGGYVVAPPSLHASGHRYRWLRAPNRLPPMPDWLRERSRAPEPETRPQSTLQVERERLSAYVAVACEGEARAVADTPPGQRNSRLNLAAWRLGRLVGADLVAKATVATLLRSAAESAGLSQHEALTTINSGLRAGMSHPRDVEIGTGGRPIQRAEPQTGGREPGREAEAC